MALKKVHNAYMCLLQLLFILHARNSPSLFCLSVFILKLSTIYRCVSHGNLSTIDTVCTMWMKPQGEHSNENYRYIPNKKNMRFWVACNGDFVFHMYRGIVVIIGCVTIQMITVEKYVMMAAVSVLIFFSLRFSFFFPILYLVLLAVRWLLNLLDDSISHTNRILHPFFLHRSQYGPGTLSCLSNRSPRCACMIGYKPDWSTFP